MLFLVYFGGILLCIFDSDMFKTIMYIPIYNTVFSPLRLDPNKTFFTNRTRIFKKIKSGFSLFH